MKKTALLSVLFVLAAFPAFGFETVRNLSLPAEGMAKFEINAGAGFLTVTGREGATAIEVQARIEVTGVDEKDMDAWIKEHITLELRRSGGTAVLDSYVRERGFSFFRREALIDLTVTVPKSMALRIDDGSGALTVENIAAEVRVEDGSGSLRISKISGNVWVDDGSGGIVVDGVAGNLDLVDGSGEIEIRNVTGDVSIDDGSGEMILSKIGGTVTVDDGSGGIEIDDVGKDVHLKHTGSGGVDLSNVRGKVIR